MMTIAHLRQQYRAGETTPTRVIEDIFGRIRADGERPIWISLVDPQKALEQARAIDPALPLAGVPFAVKDNIDVNGMTTTAGCPSYAYQPERTAPVAQRLLDAGAILVGKTNMDQFATGLVGVRSPYGACSSIYDSRYISGGSSSGSAVAVAKGLAAFSLGTDTAGSGRVPAAFNGLIGLKPTRGLLSTNGVVPACRSLDCVSIFTRTVSDAHVLWQIAKAYDANDPYSRHAMPAAWPSTFKESFRFGVPESSQLKFFGDDESPLLYRRAIEKFEALGGAPVKIDFTPFREAAELLYSGPWVAERYAAVGEFLQLWSDGVNEIVKSIILGGAKYSAVDAYRSGSRLEVLKQRAAEQWDQMDILLLPTAGTIYRRDAVTSDPIRLNSNLGFYTNFVNLMDLAAVAVPAGFRSDGLPFGVSLIGPAFSDEPLLQLSARYLGEPEIDLKQDMDVVLVAVAGAHLSGQPLNYQLTERRGRLVRSGRTTVDYRLYALETVPPKPGLVREPGFSGPGIEVEVWAMPIQEFGGFVAAVPAPLGIGTVMLDDGSAVKGFICEHAATIGAKEITSFGGWRNYYARDI